MQQTQQITKSMPKNARPLMYPASVPMPAGMEGKAWRGRGYVGVIVRDTVRGKVAHLGIEVKGDTEIKPVIEELARAAVDALLHARTMLIVPDSATP